MKITLRNCILALALLICFDGETVGGEPSAEFILAGFKDSRERLRTGEFRVDGKVVDESVSSGRLEGPIAIYSAFDFETNKLRFDRTAPKRVPKPGKKTIGSKNDWVVGKQGGKYVWMPERTITWWMGEEGAIIDQGDYAPDWAQPWDVRTVGIISVADLPDFPMFAETIGHYERRLREGKAFTKEISPGIIRFDLREKITRIVIDFDMNKGYVPVMFAISGLPQEGQPEPPLQTRSIVKWEEHDGLWVPKYWWVGDSGQPGQGDGYEFNFTWLKVNEPIPPETFMTRGMEIPDGTKIAMMQEDKSIYLGKVGDLEPSPLLLEMEPADERWAWWVWTLIGVAVLIVLTAIGFVTRSHLRKT